MTRKEQEQFVSDLISKIRSDLMKKLPRVPENWDGIELRRWIADAYGDVAYMNMDRKRKKEYRNDVIVNNL